MAETNQIELFVSDFAWEETYKPLDESASNKKERLTCLINSSPKVARIGEWVLGENILGSDDSVEIENTLLKTSRPDREQFLSYAALSLDFFVTKDKHFLKKSVRSKLTKQYKFQIGTPDEFIHWIEEGQ